MEVSLDKAKRQSRKEGVVEAMKEHFQNRVARPANSDPVELQSFLQLDLDGALLNLQNSMIPGHKPCF